MRLGLALYLIRPTLLRRCGDAGMLATDGDGDDKIRPLWNS